ncbi:MAG: Clp protease ClpP [Peptococcaceae bacterium]|nr:Clp protease ClpP [Peptococcaceae bacterium]
MSFYEFKNATEETADLYIYGAIIFSRGGYSRKDDKSPADFQKDLEGLSKDLKTLNILINSPGGDVFAASTMVSMLERVKGKGIKVIAYVDGISASAASFLMMVADEIRLYKNSMVLVHKPMTWSFGNANDLRRDVASLDKIEDSVMMPLYMGKAKSPQEKIADKIDAETWLNADNMNEHFHVTLLRGEKLAVASIQATVMDGIMTGYMRQFPEAVLPGGIDLATACKPEPEASLTEQPDTGAAETEAAIRARLEGIRESILAKKIKECTKK